jgi:cyclic lactone autoinducer peptide
MPPSTHSWIFSTKFSLILVKIMTFFSSKKVLSCSPMYCYQPRQHTTAAQHASMLSRYQSLG